MNLDVTDLAAAMILTSAAQSRRRRLRIAKALLPAYQALRAQQRSPQRRHGARGTIEEIPSEFEFSGADPSSGGDGSSSETEEGEDSDARFKVTVPTDRKLSRSLSLWRARSLLDRQAPAAQARRQPPGTPSSPVSMAPQMPVGNGKGPCHQPPGQVAREGALPLTTKSLAAKDAAEFVQSAGDSVNDTESSVVSEVVAGMVTQRVLAAPTQPGQEEIQAVDQAIEQLADAIGEEVERLGEAPLDEAVLSIRHEASLDLTTLPLDAKEPAIWFNPEGSSPERGVSMHGAGELQAIVEEQSAHETASSSPKDDEREREEEAVAKLTAVIERAKAAHENGSVPGTSPANSPEGTTHSITLHLPTMLTPTENVEELGGALAPETLEAAYTGRHEPVPAGDLHFARRFLRFASAVYSLQPSVERERTWTNPICGSQQDPHDVVFTALGQLEAVAEDESLELLHLNCSNRVLAHLPYLIALDHAERAVVLSIRGTISMADLVTDAVVYPEIINDWLPEEVKRGISGPALAHAGMVAAARAIFEDMQERGTLGELMEGDEGQESGEERAEELTRAPAGHAMGREQGALGGNGAALGVGQDEEVWQLRQQAHGNGGRLRSAVYKLGSRVTAESLPPGKGKSGGTSPGRQVGQMMRQKIEEEGWRLIVVGHSLGAGAAALISLKLRTFFPDLKCIAYSAPGGLISKNLAHAMAPFCTTVAVGKDAVPRATVATMARLMDELMISLARCKQPKMRVLFAPWWRRHKRRFRQLFHDYQDIPPEAAAVLVSFHR